MKIAVIGAGITGLYLSLKLSLKGCKVTLFEQRREVGKECCSGLFSHRIIDFIPQSKQFIEKEIKKTLIHFPKKTIQVSFDKPFLIINHSALDRLLLSLAKQQPIEMVFGSKVKEIPQGFDRVIGCDGADSEVRKGLHLPEPKFYLGIQGFSDKKTDQDYVETWPTCSGFIWKIPKANQTEYGIMETVLEAKKLFQQFLDNKKIFLNSQKAALIPHYIKPIIPKKSNITLCGDAAGITKPWSGGGVVWSLTAADILLRNFPNFVKYRKEVNRFFIPKLIGSNIIKKSVYLFGGKMPYFLPEKYTIESDFLF